MFEAVDRARMARYKLTSTVILHLGSDGAGLGAMDLSGNMTRQVEQDLPVDDDDAHIVNIGRLVEDMELKMRNMLQEVYFGKAKDVVGDLRSECFLCYRLLLGTMLTVRFAGITPLTQANKEKATQREMISEWSKKNPET